MSLRLWLQAARPRTLTGAAAPVPPCNLKKQVS